VTDEMARIRAEYDSLMERSVRPMPDNFAPRIRMVGNTRVCRYRVPEGIIQLGYEGARSDRLDRALKQSVWQAAQLVRLGKLDEVREFMGALPQVPANNH